MSKDLRDNYDLGILAGVAQERERILQLLEDNNNCTGGLSYGDCTCTAIALIEGETDE